MVRGGQRIVAGDHDGTQAHLPQAVEPLLHVRLEDVFEGDDPRDLAALGHDERGSSFDRDAIDDILQLMRNVAATIQHEASDRVDGAFPYLAAVRQVHPAHPRLRAERHQGRPVCDTQRGDVVISP